MNLRLSPSAIADFRECPAKYWRNWLAPIRWSDNPVYFGQGHVVHKLSEIALLGQAQLRKNGDTPKEPAHWIETRFAKEWAKEARKVTDWKGLKPEKAMDQARGASLAAVSEVNDWEVEATEQRFEVPVESDVVVPGVIDIRKTAKQIIDIKTYGDGEEPYTNPKLNSEQTQPLAYALGAWHLTGIAPSEFLYLKVPMTPPHTVSYSPVIPLTEHHAFAYLAIVRMMARAIRRSAFRPRWSGGCKTCPHKSKGGCLGQ